jgi:hypothetical protein
MPATPQHSTACQMPSHVQPLVYKLPRDTLDLPKPRVQLSATSLQSYASCAGMPYCTPLEPVVNCASFLLQLTDQIACCQAMCALTPVVQSRQLAHR